MLHSFATLDSAQSDSTASYPRLSHEDEARLTEQARQGDTQAREGLVLSLVPKVRAFAFKYKDAYHSANRRLEVDDLVQEAVLRMWDKFDMAIEKDNPCAYLLVVAYNTIRRYCHLHATAITTPDDPLTYSVSIRVDSLQAPLGQGPLTLLDVVPALTHESATETCKDYSPLYQAVEELPRRQREVVVQHYGLFNSPTKTLQCIEQERGVSEAVVYKQHQQGIGKLQARLASVYPSLYDEGYRPAKRIRPEERTIPPKILARLEKAYQERARQGYTTNAFQLRYAAKVEYRYASAYLLFQSQSGKQPSSSYEFQCQTGTGGEQPSSSYHIDCAWCMVEQGQPLGSGSHGICSAHAEEILAQSRARRFQSQPRLTQL